MRTLLITFSVFLVAMLAGFTVAALVIELGWIDVAASEAHSESMEWLLSRIRERSVEIRAAEITVPPLGAPERLAAGARIYRELCSGCHGAPGSERSVVGRGLNPPPPELSGGIGVERAGEAYWVTAHGIRMSGMPAFAAALSEEQIWDVVALLVAMKEMTPEEYEAVLHSPGHGDADSAGRPDPASGQ